MSSYRQVISSRCLAPCEVTCPQPIANAWNQPCVTSCGDSRAVIYPPPVVMTFPGPILSSCPQESVVGSSAPSSTGNLFGSTSFLGASGSYDSRSSYSYGRPYSSYGSRGYGLGSCRPC
ncbi:PREDICTED: feather keratin 4-like [Buceros rhinoceros silvestris]|uniref:feather keratin 4-like n=1 Tax=Buceros rhinoceros silvestris TaxID=175836 RepID=UPI00052859FC|nr:PREDICTED: feather keratin 4-like [Buceros rhinoceros silvestris]